MTYVASRRYGTKAALASVLGLSLMAATALPGCTDPATRAEIDQSSQSAQRSLDEAAHQDISAKRYNPLVVSDKVWTGNTALRMHRGMPLPPKFESSRGVTIVSAEPMTLNEIINQIGQKTGIPFHIADAGARVPVGGLAPQGGLSQQGGVVPAPVTGGGFGVGAVGGGTMPVAYEGPLSGLLERVAGHFGVNWRYDGSTISVTRFETRVFVVESMPGKLKVEEGMVDDTTSNNSSSGGATGGSSGSNSQSSLKQNSKVDMDLTYWEELEKTLNSMLGGTGTVVAAPSMGLVTVTTTQEIMRTVADFMTLENLRASRQIAVNVEIYSVSLSRGLDFNIAFNTVLRRMANFSANLGGASAPTTVSGFTGGGTLSLAILNPHSHTGEITDVFTALSGIGDTTKVAKFPLVTLSNRPVARRVGEDVTYVASTTTNTGTTSTASGFAGTTLTPGTVHQGFSVQLTPRLLDDGRVLLQYSLSIIDVLSIDSFNSVCGASASASCTSGATGSSTIQLPTTSNRIFVQQSVLKSGSTLILGGAEENDAAENSQGVGDPYNYVLGGGNSSSKKHTMVFFALTPQVLDVPHSELE
jgi:type IVB pilus formation R64 PilN family outer membrane protein